MKILLRKIKYFFLRRKPCTYESKHGHDFERVGEIRQSALGKYAMYKCSVCDLKAAYSQFDGAFIKI